MKVRFSAEGTSYVAEVAVDADGALEEILSVEETAQSGAQRGVADWSALEATIEATIEAARSAAPWEATHLATAGRAVALCGIELADGVPHRHPSKARKEDCAECRAEWRRIKALKSLPSDGELKEFPDGSVWEVTDVGAGSMGVKCVIGAGDNKKGRIMRVSLGSALREVTEEEMAERRREAEKIADARTEAAAVAAGRRPRFKPTPEEVAMVRKLRADGMKLEAIETEMGWPEGHGNRPHRILKGDLRPKGE